MNAGRLHVGAPLVELRGIGPKRSAALAEERFFVVEDLLAHFPVRYEDRRTFLPISELTAGGKAVSLTVSVISSRVIHTRRKGFRIVEALVQDPAATLKVVWYNQPYLKQHLTPGRDLILYGRPVADRKGELVLQNPEIEMPSTDDDPAIHTGRIVPVYRRLAGLSTRMLRTLVFGILERLEGSSAGPALPPEITGRPGAMNRLQAIREVHFPPGDTDQDRLASFSTPAWLSLAFEEMFLLQLGLGFHRARYRSAVPGARSAGRRIEIPDPAALFPFRFTAAQERVAGEIAADLVSPRPMARLLQGDVGSGKTAVAVLAMLGVAGAGRQAALMAPTGILAAQHHRNLLRILEAVPERDRPVLLTGSTAAGLRREILAGIADGSRKLVVGTHALFDAGVRFRDLGLAVVDEQHRFGVLQRAALADKNGRPDLLVMTATPIPRTVAMTVYGDLDISVIDELPPGREPVRTLVRGEKDRAKVYQGIREAVQRGRQVYIVVPTVEDEDGRRLKSATGHARRLAKDVFPETPVGLLHGRLSADEKIGVMDDFRSGRLPILVATTVIEVGLDVPNATVMVVEDADRFGLAQLHQLRGRVGRGGGRSYCILMNGEGPSRQAAEERLAVIAQTTDGFLVAEKDLLIRGPGSLLGVEQHGAGDMWFVRQAVARPELLAEARAMARKLLEKDGGSLLEAERVLGELPARWRARLRIGRVG